MPPKIRTARPVAQLRQGRNDWYHIENSIAGGPATLSIYGEISYWGVTASDMIAELAGVTADVLNVHVNSPGGEIFDGIAIKNALEQHPATVNVTIDSLAASIASVIAMAGDTISMAPGSQMMIHDGSGLCVGNGADMHAMAELLDRQSDNIANIYAARAGGTAEEWRTRMRAETWYTADEAVAAGLADKVLPARQRPAQPDNSWDLSVFNYAGREHAPAPAPLVNVAVPRLTAEALPVHHTATVDEPWDGPAAVAAMPNDAAVLRYCHAWEDSAADDGTEDDPDGDPDDKKSSYKFPHHKVKGGPANLAACRNGLARLEGSSIPDGDKPGVRKHLQAHLDDAAKDDDAEEPSDVAEPGLTDWDPATFRAAMARATGELTDWDPEMFRSAVHASATNAPAAARSAPAPTVAPAAQGWADPAPPAPEPARSDFAEIFRAAVAGVANSAPAPTAPPPAAAPATDPFDPTVVTRALRDEVRR